MEKCTLDIPKNYKKTIKISHKEDGSIDYALLGKLIIWEIKRFTKPTKS